VPEIEEREEIILKYHALGHFAAGSTFEIIRPYLYWHKMLDDITKVISECEPCIRNNNVRAYNHSVLAREADNVFELFQVVYIFGLPETDTGESGILLITDKVSKWAKAYTVSDKSAETTLKYFKKWIKTKILSIESLPVTTLVSMV